MRKLSKSKIVAFTMCKKRLWLSIHKPGALEEDSSTVASYAIGNEVGEKAQDIYDSSSTGMLIEPDFKNFKKSADLTQQLMADRTPVFEATFLTDNALALADVMLPGEGNKWRMIEVKSATSVKDYYHDDVAIQAHIASEAGVSLESVSLAYVDNKWTYQGDGDFTGLLKEADLTEEALSRSGEVKAWIAEAHTVADSKVEPNVPMGVQCKKPFECGFASYCSIGQPLAEKPLNWLPNIRRNDLKAFAADNPFAEIEDVPDDLLNEEQIKVKNASVSGEVYFDHASTKAALAGLGWPAYFLDFETANFPVPKWAGWRPYRQVPFQFSLHVEQENGTLTHDEFIDLSGNDPTRGFAESLVEVCGLSGPIFVYNASFEIGRIKELAERHSDLRGKLLALTERVKDLFPIAKKHYYHPSQKGSWSIKFLLPAVVPEMDYSSLEGVQDGGMAMEAYKEAVNTNEPGRNEKLKNELLEYCKLDTLAMVKIWEAFR